MINDNQYGTYIEQLMVDFYKEHKSEYGNYTSYCMMNCYFITLTFDKSKIERKYALSSGTHRGSFEFENFHRFYNSVCKTLVGRHYDRPVHLNRLPLAITVLDVEGSRYARSMPNLKNIHIHSIWMSTPEFTSSLSKILMDPDFKNKIPKGSDFDQIDVRTVSIDESGSISHNLANYVSKSIRLNENKMSLTEDMRVYPMQKNHMETIERFRPSQLIY